MKKILSLFVFLLSLSAIQAQIEEPVKWSGEVEKISDTEYNLIYKATIEDHWHLYSQHLPEGGALPTVFAYDDTQLGKTFELKTEDAAESKTITKYDKVFEMDMTFFDHNATFVHRVKLLDASLKSIEGEVEFQTCDDAKCLFESAKLNFDLTTGKQVEEGKDQYSLLSKNKTEEVAEQKEKADEKEDQIYEPVSWTTKAKKIGDNEFRIYFIGKIDEGWHVYSQEPVEDGPVPTSITFVNKDEGTYELIDPTKESKGHVEFDKVFEKEIKYFENKANFRQKVKFNGTLTDVLVELEYMACDDTKCLPPTIEKFAYTYKDGELVPVEKVVASNVNNVKETVDENKKAISGEDKEKKKDNWTIFLGTLLAGILVTFTPCVFPMIPMTVSFFLKHGDSGSKAKGRFNALFYGFCIIFIYVLISVPFHLFESLSPDIFNEISTNVYLNLFFFVIFMVFALSFLGAFEITMPSGLANKVDSASNLGGLFGIFFMALTLIIVSFSCTGPALGLVLGSVLSTDGGATILTLAMLGFGLGLALPFMLFALFPSLMKNMPKSGGWLNTVKVVFGFIELALAFKFLSNADLVLQLHLLEREVFIAIWVAVFGALSLYLFGKIQLPHDSPLTNISVGRLMLGLLTLTFTIYLIPGLWGAPLKIISGLPPSQTYSESPYGVGYTKLGGGSSHEELPEHAHHGPHDIVAFHDYDHGLAYAKKVGKPVLIDFTGHACVNCRKMEDNVWSNESILNVLKKDVVLVSLYVDDKRELPKSEQYVSEHTGKDIRTIGNKWSELSIVRFKANVQPYYVLMNHGEENLNEPVGYTPDAEEYLKWLKEGISKFKK